MSVEFTPWPQNFADLYRQKGYWTDVPITHVLENKEMDSPAVICGDRTFTYQNIRMLSDILAQHFLSIGCRSGDTALVQLPNIAEFYIVFFALLKVGVAPVNALFSHNQLELTSYAKQISPRILIASRTHKLFQNDDFIDELTSRFSSIEHVFLESEEGSKYALSGVLSAPDTDVSFHATPTPADQVAFFQLSGGSTGTPKLIPRTHNDYYFSIRRSADICELTAATRYLCALPCAHNYPMSSPGALGVFDCGGVVVMSPNPDAMTCFDIIAKHKVTMAALVPPAAALWVQAAPDHSEKLKSLSLMQVGGAKLSETLARRIPQVLNCQLQQVLGMAEGLVNYTRLDDDEETIFTTQGRPMCSLDEVKVVDDKGNPVPDGTPGLLVTRGPYTIRGYYKAPAYNASAFDEEGFYHSGDLVCRNEKGYLTVVGRDKDQINRGGEKIAAEEIENLLLKHDMVIHSALVAMPDQMMGEKSCAFIVPKQENHGMKSVSLRKYLRSQGVADYKIPDRFEFIETLPLTPVGKPDKVSLRLSIQSRLQQNTVTLGQNE